MKQGAFHKLHLRVVAEKAYESPLHQLPQLLRLMEARNLKSYALHFIANAYGRFDVEINSQAPEIINTPTASYTHLDMHLKTRRLHRLFYGKPKKAYDWIDIHDFMHVLACKPSSVSAVSEQQLFRSRIEWRGLHQAYFWGEQTRDTYYYRLKTDKHIWVAPALVSKPCPFDQPLFLQKQVVFSFQHFLVAVNYRPIGDAAFHLLIIPHQHEADLTRAKPEQLFELEALLRATSSIGRRRSPKLAIYMQKHAQSGMTVPHMHIHVVVPPEKKAFRAGVLRELRFLSSVMVGCEQEARFWYKPSLSIKAMQCDIRRLAVPLYQALKYELGVQYRRFTLFSSNSNIKPVDAASTVFHKK